MKSRFFIFVLACLLCKVASATISSHPNVPPPHPTLATSMGWQYGKTLAECNRYMLEHQLATDIGFLVGPRGEAKSLVRAHRYVLLSRSPVFTKLLQQNNAIDKDQLPATSSEYSNTTLPIGHPLQTIEIPDMNPAVFKQLLNFIYTDDATFDLHNVIPLMYAAKKYQLPNLINECQKVLQQNISIENVCIILNQAVYFNEQELINKTLEFIGMNVEPVMETAGFLDLYHDSIKALISYDRLDTNETALFKYCMRWVEARMQEKNQTMDLERAAPAVRSILGELIFHIRFPLMQQKEFADLVGTSDLLTCDEKASIYYYIATEDPRNNTLAFDWKPRIRKRVLDRFNTFTANGWSCPVTLEKIQLTVNRSVTLTAVGTYKISPHDQNIHYYQYSESFGKISTLSVSITRRSEQSQQSQRNMRRQRYENGYPEVKVGETQSFNFTHSGQERNYIIEVPLDKAIKLEPNYYYTIALQVPYSQNCFAGYGRNDQGVSLPNEGVMFTFYGAGTNSDENHGQIPRLYYYL